MMRRCKRCDASLGSDTQKCPMCGQLNPTLPYVIAPFFALGFGLLVFVAILVMAL